MDLKGILSSISISARGLAAMRRRLDAVANNLANAETTRVDGGGPYRRRVVAMRQTAASPAFSTMLRAEGEKPNSASLITRSHPQHIGHLELPELSSSSQTAGVIAETVEVSDSPRMVFDPDHPDADERGYVAYPNINIVQEMVDLMTATRAYEANVTVISAEKEMAKKALEI